MQQYPNYFPMNNYPGNYGQQAQYGYNPYNMQRLDHLQQFQQNLQQQQMPVQSQTLAPLGKIVESIDIVKATDIPMDGNLYYFPKADGSEIYAKQWLANGTTQILAFKPVLDVGQGNVQDANKNAVVAIPDDLIDVLMKRFDELSERFKKLENSIIPVKTRKEVSNE